MATLAATRPAPLRMSRRVVEWGLLGCTILILVIVFLREARKVQAQAELAAVRTTLAALRTTAVLQFIEASAKLTAGGNAVAGTQQNPFTILQSPPPNYLGEQDLHNLPADVSGWFFDAACRCIGYAPAQGQELWASNGAPLLLFRVGTGPGPMQLLALDDYRWQGEPVR